MKYSFTQPFPKSIISYLTKIWLFYIILSVGMIYLNGIYLNIKADTFKATKNMLDTQIDTQDENINTVNIHTNRLNYELKLDNLNKYYNNELKDAIIKLFSLIPDQITITYIELEEKKLVLKGITPSRETYSFLLQAPLKSIFNTSKVDYFPLPNGWYNFTSISTLDEK